MKIIKDTTALFVQEPNMLEVDAPVVICGDIRGQYYDLLKILSIGGPASHHLNRYLFLGSYVGNNLDESYSNGKFGIECVLLLFAWKIAYPKNVFMLRGKI